MQFHNFEENFAMRKIILFGIIIIALGAFAKKPPKKPKTPTASTWVEPAKPKLIYGNWTWFETDCCGSRRGVSTPESSGDNISLELRNDYTFIETHSKKNALPREGNIILFKQDGYNMIQFNDERPARYYLSDNNDTLTLSWKYMELQTEKYIRKKN